MIEYLQNSEIDRVKWDACIGSIPSCKPYAFSWYLDIMASGWEALVDDDYDSVFPVPSFRKYGFHYIATPVFLQQLGIFSPDNNETEKLNEYLSFMPRFYRLVDLSLAQKPGSHGFRITERDNYELSLMEPYEVIRKNYSSDCRRNIRLALDMNPVTEPVDDPWEAINLFRANTGLGLKGVKMRDYNRLAHLIDFCVSNGKGRLSGVRNSNSKLIYAVFLVTVPGNVTMLFTATSNESRNNRTGYFVIDDIIREFAGTETVLDFAGSSIPSIAAYNRSFGAARKPYYRIYRNRLPWPVRMFK